jgi:two-component system chemotaxis response regulator CheB
MRSPGHDIIAIGTSAGGVEALKRVVGDLPHHLPASIFVVLHLPPQYPSSLPAILARSNGWHAAHAKDGEPIRRGHIYIAPPDRHLLVERGRVKVIRGPRENRFRPAVDPLFRTAARAYGPRVIGVILTGALDDGAAGLYFIKECGGLTVVQDPRDAIVSDMPRHALENVEVDHCLPLAQIPKALADLVHRPASRPRIPCDVPEEAQVQVGTNGKVMRSTLEGVATPGQMSCPECRGPMWELADKPLIEYRCQVGHAYTSETLQSAQSESIERALWSAVSALEDKAALSRRLALRMREARLPATGNDYEVKAEEASRQADEIRKVILSSPALRQPGQRAGRKRTRGPEGGSSAGPRGSAAPLRPRRAGRASAS